MNLNILTRRKYVNKQYANLGTQLVFEQEATIIHWVDSIEEAEMFYFVNSFSFRSVKCQQTSHA